MPSVTSAEAARQINAVLLLIRGEAGRAVIDGLSDLDTAIAVAVRALARLDATFTRSERTVALRAVVYSQMEQVFEQLAARVQVAVLANADAVIASSMEQLAEVHRLLFDAVGLEGAGISTRLMSRVPLLTGALRKSSAVPRFIDRRMLMARAAAIRFTGGALDAGLSGAIVRQTLTRALRGVEMGAVAADLPAALRRTLTPLASLPSGLRTIITSEVYNGMRETTTEASRESPIILLGHWDLSARHNRTDACDELAHANMGYGPGWYTPDAYPRAPHPHCACYQGGVRTAPVRDWS